MAGIFQNRCKAIHRGYRCDLPKGHGGMHSWNNKICWFSW